MMEACKACGATDSVDYDTVTTCKCSECGTRFHVEPDADWTGDHWQDCSTQGDALVEAMKDEKLDEWIARYDPVVSPLMRGWLEELRLLRGVLAIVAAHISSDRGSPISVARAHGIEPPQSLWATGNLDLGARNAWVKSLWVEAIDRVDDPIAVGGA